MTSFGLIPLDPNDVRNLDIWKNAAIIYTQNVYNKYLKCQGYNKKSEWRSGSVVGP